MTSNISSDSPLTALLEAWRSGEGAAFDALIESTYRQLKAMAEARLRGDNALVTLNPQELLHEAVARVMQSPPDYRNRGHFFATMSLLMRAIIVDHARARLADKRGGGRANVTFTEGGMGEESIAFDILALDQALERLAEVDVRSSNILHLTYFAGIKQGEIASLLGISLQTVERDLRFARAWLHRTISNA